MKESKDLVDSAPQIVKQGISRHEAQSMREELEAADAQIELKRYF